MEQTIDVMERTIANMIRNQNDKADEIQDILDDMRRMSERIINNTRQGPDRDSAYCIGLRQISYSIAEYVGQIENVLLTNPK